MLAFLDKKNALISQDLARIVTDFSIDATLADTKLSLNWDSIYAVFKTYNFTRLISKYEHNFSNSRSKTIQYNQVFDQNIYNLIILRCRTKYK